MILYLYVCYSIVGHCTVTYADSVTAIFNQIYLNAYNNVSNVLPAIENVSMFNCIHRCIATKLCKSVNYGVNKSVCELISATPPQIQIRQGWQFITSNYTTSFSMSLQKMPQHRTTKVIARTTNLITTTLPTTVGIPFVEQSSTFKNNFTYASRAIDGVFANNDINFCAVTTESYSPWWKLTLPEENIIHSVKVVTIVSIETKRLGGFKLKIGDAREKYILCGHLTGVPSRTLVCNVRGKYVFIGDKKAVDKLILCEVEVTEL
ncbi:uncharacterized protein LOC101239793 isoform X1 [Hydra vulgaris]|uniref:uncharacterized protein LOC101239793 isoform X1 n=1 Tax=Hydra vulgaris TaxID=6087 RepID=UPI0006417319|nr:uncharacterized protein LOC101239793 [Hydra vulgaris]